MKRLLAACCWSLATLFLGWLSISSAALAHESRPAYLEIAEKAPGQYDIAWRVPVLAGMRLPVVLRLPADVNNLREPLVQHLSDSVLERRWIDAGPEGLAGKRISFPGLELTITEAVVRVELLDGRSWMTVARPSHPWVALAADRSIWAVAIDFARQGFEHILSGPDHLLFVFGLLLVVSGPWMLIKTITAFTVAHSITLAAATLGYVQPPAPPIEAAIALSIVFLGREILRARQGATSFTIRNPWVVAFVFGLLHGFGFASALSAAGLPPAAVPLALVSFNVGVEIGQLAFVALVLILASIIRRLPALWSSRAQVLPPYLVGCLGAFWFVQRIVSF